MNGLRAPLRNIVRRRGRNAMTITAIGLGAASLVAVLGINDAAAQQTSDRLSAYEAAVVTVSLPSAAWSLPDSRLAASVASTPGVIGAGTLTLPAAGTRPSRLSHPRSGESVEAGTVIASAEGLIARQATLVSGGIPSDAVSSSESPAILLGTTLARDLDLTSTVGSNLVLLGGRTATVVGIVRDTTASALNGSVIMTPGTARALGALPEGRSMILRVEPGTAEGLAELAPALLYPRDAANVSVGAPPSPQKLKQQLVAANRWLIVAIGLVMLLSAGVGIATTMQVSVRERHREIGLSRALGMTRKAVARSFLVESTVLGGIGCSAGWCLGVLITAATAVASHWTLTMPPVVALIPAGGALLGGLAGLVPAVNATKVDPAALLRA